MFEIGSTLRQARERRQIGLDQAESETKIRSRYLRALEEEDFNVLPGPTYVRGFLRTYADYLGLDGRLFADEYASRFAEPRRDHDVAHLRRRTARSRRQGRESSIILVALAGIVAVALLVIIASTFPKRDAAAPPPAAATSIKTVVEEPINPALVQAEDGTTAADADGRLELVITANGAAAVKVWRGGKASGDPILDEVLDPDDEDGGRSRALRSRTGFTIVAAEPAKLMLLVDGVPEPLPRGTRFRVEPDGAVRAVA